MFSHNIKIISKVKTEDRQIVFFILLSLIFLLGVFLRLYQLAKEDLWLDEVLSVINSSKNLPELLSYLVSDANMPFYFFLLHWWLLVSKSAFWIRLFSAAFGALAIIIIYKLSSYLFNRRVGLISAFFLAISPYHLWYSQEARAYSLQIFLVLLSMFYYVRIFKKEKPQLKDSAFLILFSILAIFAHYISAFILLTQIVFLNFYFLIKTHPPAWIKKIIIIQLIFIVLLIPYLPKIMTLGLQKIPGWIPRPSIEDIGNTFKYYALGVGIVIPKITERLGLLWYISAFLPIIFLPFYASNFRISTFSKIDSTILIIFWLIIPILSMFLISLKRPLYLAQRYLIVSLPAFILLVSYGITLIGRKKLFQNLFLAILSIAPLTSLTRYYASEKKIPWTKIVKIVLKNSKKDDCIVFVPPWLEIVFQYHLQSQLTKTNSQEYFLKILSYEDIKEIIRSSVINRRIWLLREDEFITFGGANVSENLNQLYCSSSVFYSTEIEHPNWPKFWLILYYDFKSTERDSPIIGAGWHSSEKNGWRWTSKQALCYFINPKADSVLEIAGGGCSKYLSTLPVVTFYLNNQKLDEFILDSEWFEKKYNLTSRELGYSDLIELRLDISDTFVPSKIIPKSTDNRELGLGISKIKLSKTEK